MGRVLYEADGLRDPALGRVIRFIVMCVLEEVSFTLKDGQYLRWDWRSGRRCGKTKFDKGTIFEFEEAFQRKVNQVASDLLGNDGMPLDLSEGKGVEAGEMTLHVGSCIEHLPRLRGRSLTGVVTSPPYCNRYDYTRTYALELAFLGVGEDALKDLRQTMVSCTVENHIKENVNQTCVAR